MGDLGLNVGQRAVFFLKRTGFTLMPSLDREKLREEREEKGRNSPFFVWILSGRKGRGLEGLLFLLSETTSVR